VLACRGNLRAANHCQSRRRLLRVARMARVEFKRCTARGN